MKPMTDYYVPKRRIPVVLWSLEFQGFSGQVFLDLDGAGNRHQTILEKLNERCRFLPLAVGENGQIHLVNKERLARVTPGPHVVSSDVLARGFGPARDELAEVRLNDGSALQGRMWMPLQRESQRPSDFLNMQGSGFFALLTPTNIHLVNASAVLTVKLAESAGAPLGLAAVPNPAFNGFTNSL
jgi:hypothetical protein